MSISIIKIIKQFPKILPGSKLTAWDIHEMGIPPSGFDEFIKSEGLEFAGYSDEGEECYEKKPEP